MLGEFKAFIMKGNVIDLAIAFVIATAFKPIINTVVDGVIMPIIARIFGKPDFHALTIDLGKGATIAYGSLITVIVNFILVGIALFAIIKLKEKFDKKEEETPAAPPAPSKEEVLLGEIRDLLKK